MRNSEKRNKILELFRINHLLTANEICSLLPEIDRATIYRNLALFAQKEVLKEVNLIKGVTSFELNSEENSHQHFICTNCNKIFSFKIDAKKIKTFIPKAFKFNAFELNLKGLCDRCSVKF